MKKLLLSAFILLCCISQSAAWMNVTTVGGGVPAAGGFCSNCVGDGYTVCWDMTATGLDCYDATDGSTTTENSVTFDSDGMTVNDTADYARFVATQNDNLTSTSWEIGFKYKATGSPGSYCFFYDHDQNEREISFIRNSTNANVVRIYMKNVSATLTSTVSNIFDGNEHTIVTYYDGSSNVAVSVDGEDFVTAARPTSTPREFTTGNLYIGGAATYTSSEIACTGVYSDVYIKSPR